MTGTTTTARRPAPLLRPTLCIACGASERDDTGPAVVSSSFKTRYDNDFGFVGDNDEKREQRSKSRISSEKQSSSSGSLRTPCCRSLICAGCLQRNPRLQNWNPCLWCGITNAHQNTTGYQDDNKRRGEIFEEVDVKQIADEREELEQPAPPFEDDDGARTAPLGTGLSNAAPHPVSRSSDTQTPPSSIISASLPPPFESAAPPPPPPAYEAVFDRDATELSMAGPRAPALSPVPLPPQTRRRREEEYESSSSRLGAASSFPATSSRGAAGSGSVEDPFTPRSAQQQQQPLVHTIRRGDTLRSIALRYSVDPHDLLRMNDLPHACLAGNEGLLQARREVVVRRNTLEALESDTGGGMAETQEEVQRKHQRMVKRFQLVTKQVDADVARAYLAVQEVDDAQAQGDDGAQKEDTNVRTSAAELDGRAIDRYFEDDGWESGAKPSSSGSPGANPSTGKKEKSMIQRLIGGGAEASSRGGQTTSSLAPAKAANFKHGTLLQGAPWA